MKKRNRIALLLVFPVAIFIWFVGWSLYWIGSREKPKVELKGEIICGFL